MKWRKEGGEDFVALEIHEVEERRLSRWPAVRLQKAGADEHWLLPALSACVFSSTITVMTQRKLVLIRHSYYALLNCPVFSIDKIPLHFHILFFTQQTQRNVSIHEI